jgi:hypothetical protein
MRAGSGESSTFPAVMQLDVRTPAGEKAPVFHRGFPRHRTAVVFVDNFDG